MDFAVCFAEHGSKKVFAVLTEVVFSIYTGHTLYSKIAVSSTADLLNVEIVCFVQTDNVGTDDPRYPSLIGSWHLP